MPELEANRDTGAMSRTLRCHRLIAVSLLGIFFFGATLVVAVKTVASGDLPDRSPARLLLAIAMMVVLLGLLVLMVASLRARLIVDDNGRVVAAHGLSAVPARQHRLTLRGRSFWTWCAIDALGIPAGLGEDAVAETTCQLCGTVVRVEFKAGKVTNASHPAARVWDAERLEGRGTAGPPHCALMNLFCSAEHLAEWRAAHPGEQGRERDLDEVGELGRSEWGTSPEGCYCQEEGPGQCGR